MNYEVYLNTGFSAIKIEIEDADCNTIAGFDKTQCAELKSKLAELRASGNVVTLNDNLRAPWARLKSMN